jgi:hypothetical protein
MSTLARRQIYIEKEQLRQLEIEAQKEHSDFSKLVRKAIDFFLKTKAKNINWEKDPLTKAIGTVELSVNDASEKHDHYIYD